MNDPQYLTPVIRTKLYRPRATADYIVREALEAKLEAGVGLPLCVVSAPAGYGKSTLLGHWLETCELPSAWLSLDLHDNDLRGFLSYFVAAVRSVAQHACPETLKILDADSLPPELVIVSRLSNDLDHLDERFILVLDDYDRIREPAIHSLLDRLLEHPLPGLHLVIASRNDPALSLTSLRARHYLNEIRIRDLQFSQEEMHIFFNQAIGRTIEPAVIARLHKSIEGWPVGVRLTSLALQHQDDTEGFLKQFGADARQMRQYLVREVLSGLTPLIRDCLLSTSICGRFNASLCEAIWCDEGGDQDGSVGGQDFIELLEKSGLFCIPLDEQGHWFRYHHLFGDLLTQQLEGTRSAEEIRVLHQRTSTWFSNNGHFEEAIHHALLGGDEARAAHFVGLARHDLINTDQWHRLERWIKLFADESVQQIPQLLLLRCWLDANYWYRLDYLVQDLSQVDTLLETKYIAADERVELGAELSAMRSGLAYWTLDPLQGIALAKQALRDSPSEREYVHSTALMMQVAAHQIAGDLVESERLAWEYIEEGKFDQPGARARILQSLCFVYWCEAEMRKLVQAASRLFEISSRFEMSWSLSFARYFLGLAHYERNQLNEAIAQLKPVVEEPYRYPIQNVTHCSFLLSLCYQALGLQDRAREVAESIARLTFESGNVMFLQLAEAFQADLDLRQGHIAKAEQWARNFVMPAPHQMHRSFNAELTAIRVSMVGGSAQNLKQAATQLDTLDQQLSHSHHRRLMIDALGMKALLAFTNEDTDRAVAFLQEAVNLAQPGELIRPLADLGQDLAKLLNRLTLEQSDLQFVGRILAALHGSDETTAVVPESQPLLDALTSREFSILGLLSQGLSNKEIADQLFISTGTVKRHLHNIYGKLAVGSRREAITKATGLGLIKAH